MLLLFLVLTPLYVEAAPIGGQAVKSHHPVAHDRNEWSTAAARVPAEAPAHVADAPAAIDAAGPTTVPDVLVVSPIEEPPIIAPVVNVVATEEPPTVARTKASSTAYLPLNGALPLRFAEARRWPAPLPPPVAPAPVVDPVAEVAQSESIAPATLPEKEVPVEPSVTPVAQPVLTADLVLGYMGKLNPETSALEARFLPAVPGARQPAEVSSISPP